MDDLIYNDQLVNHLSSAMSHGMINLEQAPKLLRLILERGAWRERKLTHGFQKLVQFDSFEEFVTTPPLDGLGITMDLIERIVVDDAEARALLERNRGPLAAHGEIGNGRDSRGDNVTSTDRGNSASYLARRILRDNPDVFEQLERGEFKSVRAAAKAAGIVREPTGLERLRAAWRKATDAERIEHLREIEAEYRALLGEARS